MNLDWPLNCSAAEEFDSRWVSGFCDYAPAPNSASRFMSAYKTLLHNNGLLQELFWITAVLEVSRLQHIKIYNCNNRQPQGQQASVSKYCFRM